MKRITLSALLMTLFLFIGCNNGGVKKGEATTSDGSVIDLKKVSEKINDTVAFAADVKEVHTLVESIDELAKAIGKKIKNDGTLEDEKDKNGSLLAGVHSVISAVKTKLGLLENKEGLSDELKAKVTSAKSSSNKFLETVKSKHNDLGKNEVTDDNAKSAIDRIGQKNGDKGAKELGELHTAIKTLLTAAKDAVTSAITALTPAKAEKTQLENK
ncbi:outer surface protein C (plasmid) [Candidatus Borrelia fainii]|uniref:Outer surface protein C n=1 Tax=Candidatus Borrelia fainii TaxID=2518322 RepID=A0ABN6UTB3_9SPIR|nr:Vsp/OspC family lipoprotein [Candidatus Borrelia fainii]BDU63417.1 outer surface protein C [Candidatus Borrelia fainii]BDU63509.1 outer surface protein C [Candidatus Borrelia fainii]